MSKNLKTLFFLVGMLVLAGLACGPTLPDDISVTVPAGAVETVQAAGQQAGSAAQTAVALATTEGSSVIATLQAIETPDLGALTDRLEAIQVDENGNFSVTITDVELNQAIQQKEETAGTNPDSPLQDPVFTFTGGNIVLSGQVTQPVAAQLTVTFRPYVEDHILKFEVISATLGSIQVPAPVLSSAESTLNSTLGQAINSLPGNLTLQTLVMGEGTMTVTGTRN
jgi:hypothetical protein